MIKHRAHMLIAVLAAAGSLALSGCDKGDKGAEEAAKQDTKSAPDPTAKSKEDKGTPQPPPSDQGAARPATGKAPVIKLIDQGAEPRQALRYKLVKGAKETLLMTMDMAMQTKMPGMPIPEIKIPTMDMFMDMEIKDLVSENEARYEFVMTDVKVKGGPGIKQEMVDMTQSMLDKAKGMHGSAIVDIRGFNRDASMSMPESMDAQMKQMMQGTVQNMEQISSPLPEEPVGKGAKWEVHQQIAQNGMTIDQVTTYELVELSGDKGKMKAKVTQKAGRQNVEVPGMAGASAELLGLESTGSGDMAFDLNRLVPTSSMAITSNYSMNVNAGGQSQTLEMHLEMKVGIGHK